MQRTTLNEHLSDPERVRLTQKLWRLDDPEAQADVAGKLGLLAGAAALVILPTTAAAVRTPGTGWPEHILLTILATAVGAFLWEGARTNWKYPSSRYELEAALEALDEETKYKAATEAAKQYQVTGLGPQHVKLQVGVATETEVVRNGTKHQVRVLYPSGDQPLTLLEGTRELSRQ